MVPYAILVISWSPPFFLCFFFLVFVCLFFFFHCIYQYTHIHYHDHLHNDYYYYCYYYYYYYHYFLAVFLFICRCLAFYWCSSVFLLVVHLIVFLFFSLWFISGTKTWNTLSKNKLQQQRRNIVRVLKSSVTQNSQGGCFCFFMFVRHEWTLEKLIRKQSNFE